MRYRFLAATLLVTAGAFALRAQDPTPAPTAGLDTVEKQGAYALGVRLGTNLRLQGAVLDGDALSRGLRDGMGGVAPVLSEAAMQEAMHALEKMIQEKAQAARKEQAKKNKDAGVAFLEKNKTAEGVQVTPTGLQYKVVKAGNGQKPLATSTVKVQYEGTLVDGTVFDSSYKTGRPFTCGLSQVIKGWTEGLQLMDVGSTYVFYIPPELAYGENPPPGPIGAGAVLVFKIELIEILAK
jgi:FKBP-type peptidyl-prolyl cis-trans isomerase FklB